MSKHVVTDSSDPDQIRQAEQEQEDQSKDMKWIMSEPRGRRFIYNLIHGTCHEGMLSYVPGDSDATAFNEGARSVGLSLDVFIRQQSPAQHAKMLEEQHYD